MKTLRLIKPWDLRPVRQRLGYLPDDTQTMSLVSLYGPAGDMEYVAASPDTVIERLGISTTILHTERGPVSDFEYTHVILR